MNSNINTKSRSEFFLLFYILYIPQCFYYYDTEIDCEVLFMSFTFHNVSINTENPDVSGVDFQNFTFHDVSINTKRAYGCFFKKSSLHSTMFLLIPTAAFNPSSVISSFTFHDISINTPCL